MRTRRRRSQAGTGSPRRVDAGTALIYPAGVDDFHHPFAPAAADIRARRPEVSGILPNLFVGEYPRCEDIHWMVQTFGISTVLSLQDADDLRLKGLDLDALRTTCAERGVEFLRTPVADYDCASLAAGLPTALDMLHASLKRDKRVFLHCNAGCNRAPTVAIAYLHAHRGMSLEAARDYFKARRACGPYMQLLYDYFGLASARG